MKSHYFILIIAVSDNDKSMGVRWKRETYVWFSAMYLDNNWTGSNGFNGYFLLRWCSSELRQFNAVRAAKLQVDGYLISYHHFEKSRKTMRAQNIRRWNAFSDFRPFSCQFANATTIQKTDAHAFTVFPISQWQSHQ